MNNTLYFGAAALEVVTVAIRANPMQAQTVEAPDQVPNSRPTLIWAVSDELLRRRPGRDASLLHGLLFAADKRVEKPVEFLRCRIVGFAKIIIQAAVVAVPFAIGCRRYISFLQHGFETPRLSFGVGIAGKEQDEEWRDAFVLGDVRHR